MKHKTLSISASDNEEKAKQFNRDCYCVTFSREDLRAELMKQKNGDELVRMLIEERPHLFADSPVFIPESYLQHQAEIIAAVERVVALPAYQERVLAYAPSTAGFIPKSQGVFLGYDFHLGIGGSQLIEINTNAGGALLNAAFARAQVPCRDATTGEQFLVTPPSVSGAQGNRPPEQVFFEMFLEEWRLERAEAALRLVAIVDEIPESQFLFPEFLLFQRLFERNHVDAVICDPRDLTLRQGKLWYRGRRVDLVYNRLTDFGLQEAANQPLRDAYLTGAIVLTPHPRAHALYADKRNLALLTDEAMLREWDVDIQTRNLLVSGIAHSEIVQPDKADKLWVERKRLFFKPAAGYGSKAVYRGDKITRRVFEEVLQGDYIAQSLVPPSERQLKLQGDMPISLKFDLRNYVYQGRVQLVATRLYQGQTTNFRTPSGGFAPVILIPKEKS